MVDRLMSDNVPQRYFLRGYVRADFQEHGYQHDTYKEGERVIVHRPHWSYDYFNITPVQPDLKVDATASGVLDLVDKVYIDDDRDNIESFFGVPCDDDFMAELGVSI